MLTARQLEELRVLDIDFNRAKTFADQLSKDVQGRFDTKVYAVESSTSCSIFLFGLEAGSLEDEKYPFLVEVEIEGYFTYSAKEDETGVGFENFIRYNCDAILYPYLRSTISTLTNIANDFPTYNLPTINITKAIQENNDN